MPQATATMPTLDQTIRAAAAGDAAAWRGLVESFTPRVFGLILRQCGDRDLADEITQATFVKIVVKLTGKDGYQEQGKFEPWLFRIAMNELRDEMRRRKRQARPFSLLLGSAPGSGGADDEGADAADSLGAGDQIAGRASNPWPDPFDQADHAEQLQRLRAAVATMSEPDREVLYLRHTAGLSFAQIAQTLGQPLGTVLARGHRALGKLRSLMEQTG
jgi:RNA polymerase sigma-70 factor (ECF subfamily)